MSVYKTHYGPYPVETFSSHCSFGFTWRANPYIGPLENSQVDSNHWYVGPEYYLTCIAKLPRTYRGEPISYFPVKLEGCLCLKP